MRGFRAASVGRRADQPYAPFRRPIAAKVAFGSRYFAAAKWVDGLSAIDPIADIDRAVLSGLGEWGIFTVAEALGVI